MNPSDGQLDGIAWRGRTLEMLDAEVGAKFKEEVHGCSQKFDRRKEEKVKMEGSDLLKETGERQ